MKMTRTLLLLLSLIPLGLQAADIESVDVVLDSLNFQMPEGGTGVAGDLRFRSLDFYSTDLFINLYDDGEVFDSKIYLRPQFFGIRGKNHALGVNVDTTALKDVKSLELVTSSFGFNEQQISFDSEELQLEHSAALLAVDNFRFFCKKHPDFPGNDIEALKYGCLSDSSFAPLKEGSPVTIKATIPEIDEEGGSAEVTTEIKSVDFKTNRIFMAADNTEVRMDEALKLNIDHMALTCKKNGDIANFDPNELIYDCIDDVAFKVDTLELQSVMESEEGKEQELKVVSKNPAIILDKKRVSVKTSEVDVKFDNMDIHGRNIHLSCDKNREGISNKDVKALIMTCLDTSSIKEMNNKYADFDVKLSDEELGNIEINANLKAIDMTNGDFSTTVGYTKVNINDEIYAGTHGLRVSCETNFELPEEITQESLENLDMDKSMNSCLNTVKLPRSQVFLSNAERDGRYFIDINGVNVSEKSMSIDIPAIQLVNEEGSNTIFNLKGKCSKNKEIMPYDHKGLIGECLRNGQFSISSIVNDEDNDEFPSIFKAYDVMESEGGQRINPTDYVKKIKPSLRDMKITAKNRYVRLEVKTKVLGMLKKAVIEGSGRFDTNSEKLILDVSKTDLPFGISSRTLSLFIIKQIMADDRVKISTSNKRITIDLKF